MKCPHCGKDIDEEMIFTEKLLSKRWISLSPKKRIYNGEEWWEVPTCGILPLFTNSKKEYRRINEFPDIDDLKVKE